jgi:hypothetical protein
MDRHRMFTEIRKEISELYHTNDISIDTALVYFKLIKCDVDHYVDSLKEDIRARCEDD